MARKKIAAAIGYESGEPAPKVLALGKGALAKSIVDLARDSGVAIVEDGALAALLEATARPGEYVPPWCWDAAARVLAFVARQDEKAARGMGVSGLASGSGGKGA
ncbi:MAG: EscU/YscU/HrcU family type III secretion system export apparatus switch protein [Treponema sp.]|nr:EscU/YscU/HrcU family type III secretion system export apparatus switch protein [Treponema sp.]